MHEAMLKVNSPMVIAEVIDGEAVIMNMASGRYFSCLGVGGEIWTLIEGGATQTRIRENLLHRYTVEPSVLDPALAGFLAHLNEHELIREETVPDAGEAPDAPEDISPAKAPYEPPVLNVYSDMEDLLLLDPIHDVDDIGWPAPKPADEASG